MPVPPELSDYIQKARTAGLSDESIRTGLLKAGWGLSDVNEAIPPLVPPIGAPLQSAHPVPTTKPVRKSRFSIAFLITVPLLLIAGGATYFFLPQIVAKVDSLIGYGETVIPVASVQPQATSTSEGWLVYENKKYSFTFQYPASYSVAEHSKGSPGFLVNRTDISSPEGYSLYIYPENDGGRNGVTTSTDIAKCCQKLYLNEGRDFAWRLQLPNLSDEPASGIYYFDFYGFKPYQDTNPTPPDFDYSYGPTLFNASTSVPFQFAYALPKGITDKDYDNKVIKTLDQTLQTFRFIESQGASSTETVDTSDWKTYKNDKYGFEIQRPANWEVSSEEVSGRIVSFVDPLHKAKPETDQPSINVKIGRAENAQSYEWNVSGFSGLPVKQVILGNGLYITLSAFDEESKKLEDKILSTFKFVTASSSVSDISRNPQGYFCDLKKYGCSAASVNETQCEGYGSVYIVSPACTDVPITYYDSTGKELASCGGMPLSDGKTYKTSSFCDEVAKKCTTGPAPVMCPR